MVSISRALRCNPFTSRYLISTETAVAQILEQRLAEIASQRAYVNTLHISVKMIQSLQRSNPLYLFSFKLQVTFHSLMSLVTNSYDILKTTNETIGDFVIQGNNFVR